MTLRLKIVSYLLVLAYLVVFGTLIYWYFQPALVFKLAPVGIVAQVEGESVVVDVPMSTYLDFNHLYINTKTIDLDGKVLRETPASEFDAHNQYKILTYSKLPSGTYNIVVTIEYKVNPITWRQNEFTLAVLQVQKGQE